MSYRTEFPDFPEAEMPPIPAGFGDVSWANETCPGFQHEGMGLLLFVDYADPEKSEFPAFRADGKLKRFLLIQLVKDGDDWVMPPDGTEPVAESDDWNDILAAIIGERFAAIIREVTTPSQLAEIRHRNATPQYAGSVCATHDFMDANEQMLEAHQRLGIKAPVDISEKDGTPEFEAACALWNAAWAYAKAKHLTAGPQEAADEQVQVYLTEDPDAHMTLAEFFRANADGIDAAEQVAIRNTLRQWGNHHGDEGAGGKWEVRLVNDDSMHAEFKAWAKAQGLDAETDGMDAEEMLRFGKLNHEQTTWLEAFCERWNALDAQITAADDARQVAEQFTARPQTPATPSPSSPLPAQHHPIIASHREQVERIALQFWHLKAEGVAAADIVEIAEAALARFLTSEGFDVGGGVTALMDGEIATDAMEVAMAPAPSGWVVGAEVEYQNGFRTTVVHVDGPFAILEQHPDPRLPAPFDTAPSFILAHGDPEDCFCFPHEDDPNVATLNEAKAQLEAEKAEA